MSSLGSIRTLLRQAPTSRTRHTARPFIPGPCSRVSSHRGYHTSPALQRPYKDDQDRESVKPRSNEGTQSNLDDDSAAHTETAFDPSKTRPEEEKESAGKEGGKGGNPLEMSGASHEQSVPLGQSGGSEMNQTTKSDRSKASGPGGQKKKGKGPGGS